MSIISKPKSDKGALVPVATEPTRQAKAVAGMHLAASPRADLLPPEINDNNRRRAVRGGLRVIIVIVVILALGGVGGAWFLSYSAQQALGSAQKETVRVTAQKAQYKDVVDAQSRIASGTAAVKVGGGTDIDWAPYLRKLQATLPAGVVLNSVSIKSADAQEAYAQSTIPFEGQRIATLTFTANSPTLPSIPTWIDGLSSLPGFVDASPDSVSQGDTGYTAGVTMHINTGAYSYRFDPEGKKGADK